MQAVREIKLGKGSGPALTFAFWSVRPDIVIDNLARFAAATGRIVHCHEVSGDYAHWMDAGFACGQAPMVFYAQRAEASVWDAQGRLAPLDETSAAVAPLLARMDTRLVDGARNQVRDLIGLTYYNGGPFALFRHTDHPAPDPAALITWDGVLDYLRRARRDGMAPHPFVPRWHDSQTGLVWSLLCHLASEGVTALDAVNAFGALRDALGYLRSLWREELVPSASIDDRGDTEALARWGTGQHLLTFTMDYLASDAARPVSIPLPRLPGASGTALMPGHALLCLNATAPPALRDRATALIAHLGGPDVHRRWLAECLFAVPYPELDADPAVLAAMEQSFPPRDAKASVANLIAARQSATVSPPTHAPWFLNWSALCDRVVRDGVLRTGTFSPDAAAEDLLEHWHRLRAQHR